MAARIPYVVERLDEWAAWMLQQPGLGIVCGAGVSSIYLRKGAPASVDNGLPPVGVERNVAAAQFNVLLQRLGQVDRELLRAVVQVHYYGTHQSATFNARDLGISKSALHARLCRADVFLDAWLRELQAARKRALDFVTKTQRP